MKKIATVISAVSMVVASASVSAWGWGPFGNDGYNNGYNNRSGNGSGSGYGDGEFDGDFGFSMNMSGRGNGRGNGRGYGNGYNGYNSNNGYGYAPYGAPVAPAVMTEEQQKAIADQQAAIAAQQAQFVAQMQNAQKQAAEFHANNPAPVYSAQPAMYGDDFMRKMEEEHVARVKEMDARMEASRKAAEQRHQEARERFEARMKDRDANVKIKTEVKVEDKAGA